MSKAMFRLFLRRISALLSLFFTYFFSVKIYSYYFYIVISSLMYWELVHNLSNLIDEILNGFSWPLIISRYQVFLENKVTLRRFQYYWKILYTTTAHCNWLKTIKSNFFYSDRPLGPNVPFFVKWLVNPCVPTCPNLGFLRL